MTWPIYFPPDEAIRHLQHARDNPCTHIGD